MLRWIPFLSLPLSCTALAQSSSSADPFAGRWVGNAAPATVDGAPAVASPDGGSGRAEHHAGAGMGGGKGHAGGARGGGRGGHRQDAAAPRRGAAEPERNERGLARLFADHVTITPLSTRIRFDDGDHAIELDRDGMNVSGVGGTVALSQSSPDLVVETLTDSGYSLRERYHLGENGDLELHASLKRPFADEPREFVRVFHRAVAPASAAAAPKP